MCCGGKKLIKSSKNASAGWARSKGEGVSSRCLLLKRWKQIWCQLGHFNLRTIISCLCERGGSSVPTGYLLRDHLSAQCRTVRLLLVPWKENKQINQSFSFPPSERQSFVTLAVGIFLFWGFDLHLISSFHNKKRILPSLSSDKIINCWWSFW